MKRPTCGTNAGYQQHAFAREIACEPCLTAHARHQVAREIRRGRTRSIRVPHDALAQLYFSATYAAQERIEQQIGTEVIDAITQRYSEPKREIAS